MTQIQRNLIQTLMTMILMKRTQGSVIPKKGKSATVNIGEMLILTMKTSRNSTLYIEESSVYKLGKGKTKYATKNFTLNLKKDNIQSAIIEKAPVPSNSLLVPPQVDEYITDIDKICILFNLLIVLNKICLNEPRLSIQNSMAGNYDRLT